MGMDATVYVGPYIRMANKVIRSEMVDSQPFKGCINHPKDRNSDMKFCPKCGTNIEKIVVPVEKKFKCDDLLEQKYEERGVELCDIVHDIQGFVEKSDPAKKLYIMQDSPIDIEAGRGYSSIFDLDVKVIEGMLDPENKDYVQFRELCNTMDELGIEYSKHLGYITYWS